jgi:hypothetical protein
MNSLDLGRLVRVMEAQLDINIQNAKILERLESRISNLELEIKSIKSIKEE